MYRCPTDDSGAGASDHAEACHTEAKALVLQKLVKAYGGRVVVDQVTLHIAGNCVTGLLGPNGAGKTTTFYMAVGMIRPDGGQVMLNGRDITGFPMHQRSRCGLGYLPQERSVFRKLTVRDNLMVILENQPLSAAMQRARADDLLDELGIAHLAKQGAAMLSGGECRRLEIARTLATRPDFILLDEPFAGIDPLAVIDIKQIITQLKNRGIGILISDHNVRDTLGVCDTACILNNGVVIETGSPRQIASSPICRQLYLGNDFTL